MTFLMSIYNEATMLHMESCTDDAGTTQVGLGIRTIVVKWDASFRRLAKPHSLVSVRKQARLYICKTWADHQSAG